MPDFSTVQTIEWPPFGCATCGAHTGPFVALNINYPGAPNVGLCTNCGLIVGRMNGMAEPGVQESLEAQVVDASTRISALERALDDALKAIPEVVSLADAKKILSDASAPAATDEEPAPAEEPEPQADEDEEGAAKKSPAATTTTTAQRKTRSGSSTTTKRTSAKK